MLLLCLGTLAVYYNGLFGGFIFDDHQNIVENSALQFEDGDLEKWIAASFSSTAGILMRPISMLSFAASYQLAGNNPAAFKAGNLLIHILCGLALYTLCAHLIPRLIDKHYHRPDAKKIAFVITAIWLLHPLHISTVLYAVQRMSQLSTFFMLMGLACYTKNRIKMLTGEAGAIRTLGCLITFTALATLSKENGALTLPLALLIEATCFQFATQKTNHGRALKIFFITTLAIPISAILLSLLISSDWLVGGYDNRDFTLWERLLTQPRIIGHYLLWILLPIPQLMGIYHDYIQTSKGLFTPPSTALFISILSIATLIAWRQRKKAPFASFGIAWFLVGHSMESTVIPLEMVFEHRNYLPSIGLIIGIVGSCSLAASGQTSTLRAATALGIALIVLASATSHRAHIWGDPKTLALTAARNHPKSARSQYEAGLAIYAVHMNQNNPDKAAELASPYFFSAMQIDHDFIQPAVSNILINHKQVLAPEATLTDLSRRLREAPLFQGAPLLMLLHRITDGQVQVSAKGVKALFEASMENPRISAHFKAMILSAYGRYHFLVMNDAQTAIALTLASTHQDTSNPILQINLSRLAIQLNEPDVAERAAHDALALDLGNFHENEINDLFNEIQILRERLLSLPPSNHRSALEPVDNQMDSRPSVHNRSTAPGLTLTYPVVYA